MQQHVIVNVSQGNQRLWVGTQGGAASLAGDTVTPLPALPNPCVHALLETRPVPKDIAAPHVASRW